MGDQQVSHILLDHEFLQSFETPCACMLVHCVMIRRLQEKGRSGGLGRRVDFHGPEQVAVKETVSEPDHGPGQQGHGEIGRAHV